MKKYFKLVTEAKDMDGFKKEYKKLVQNDNEVSKLFLNYKKDKEKMVDLIDYVIEKYKRQLTEMMKNYGLEYGEVIDAGMMFPLYNLTFTLPVTVSCVLSTNADRASLSGVNHFPLYTSSANSIAILCLKC